MGEIRAVLFDFGGTLYDYGSSPPVAEPGLLAELARAGGAEAPEEAVGPAYREALRAVYGRYLDRPFYLHRDFFADVVREALERLGARVHEDLMAEYHRRRQESRAQRGPTTLREGVYETLEALRSREIHLGIVSNTDEDGFRETMEETRLVEYFDSILSSEEAGYCKPHPGIFEQALERAGNPPPEATLFVGDSLDQDIAGANRMGLRSVLLWSRTDREPPEREPRPHHVIRRIPDILDIVD